MIDAHVSVVIPTYFRDDLLAECLESLAAQTLPVHEVVVIDDGGSGSARDVVERFGERFRYHWQPNGGQPSARNHGARITRGDWISFLDDDDLWLPDRNERVAELIKTGQVDLISGDFTKFGEGWRSSTGVFAEMEAQSPGFWDGIAQPIDAAHSIVGRFPTERLFPVYPFWPSTIVIRRDLFERIKGWNEALRGIKAEDNEFGFRAIKNGQLGLIWKPTVLYRSHPGNESSSELLNAIGRTQVWEIMRDNLDLTDIEREALHGSLTNTRHGILWSAFSQKNYSAVVQIYKKMGNCEARTIEKIKALIARLLLS